MLEGGVRQLLEGNAFAAPQGHVGRDEQFAFRIQNAVGEGIRTEPAEDDGMNGPDAGTGEHGHGGFGDHGQVNGHPVAFLDAEGFEGVGAPADIRVQFRIGDGFDLFLRIPLPDDGRLATPAHRQVPVETIDGHVEGAIGEPLGLNRAGGGVPLVGAGHRGRGDPIEGGGLFQPERRRLPERAVIHPLELIFVEVRAADDPGCRGGNPVFLHQRIR